MTEKKEGKSRLSLTDRAVQECFIEGDSNRDAFANRCRNFLERRNADAFDYAELEEVLNT